MLQQVWSTWTTVAVVVAVVALPLVCCLPGYLVSVSH